MVTFREYIHQPVEKIVDPLLRMIDTRQDEALLLYKRRLDDLSPTTGTINADEINLDGSISGTLTLQAAAVTTSHTLTFPGAQGAANSFLSNDGSGTLSWSTDVARKSVTNTFTAQQIIDVTTDTPPLILEKPAGTEDFLEMHTAGIGKSISFDSGGSMNTTGATALTTWAATGVIGSGDFVALNFEDLTAAAGGTTLRLPTVTGTTNMVILLRDAVQTFTNKTGTLMGVGTSLRVDTASSGASFADTTVNTKRLRPILSSAVGNNTFTVANTVARNYTFTDASGNVLLDSSVAVDDDGDVVTYEGEVVLVA